MISRLIIFVSVLSCGFLFSQEINCADKISQLSTSLNDRNFISANTILKELTEKCPSDSEKIYLNGVKVLQYNIDNATASDKENKVNELLKLYDNYDKFFPENKNGNSINKAMVLYNSKIGKDSEIYTLLDNAYKKNKEMFTNGNPLYIYFSLFNEKFKDEKNKISVEQLLEKYNDVAATIKTNTAAFPQNRTEFNNAQLAIQSLTYDYLTPKYLVPFATNNFDKNKNNAEWLESTANVLLEKCDGEPIFGQIVKQLTAVKPSSKSIFLLASYYLKTNKKADAITLFKQSAALETDKLEKSRTYYLIASQVLGSDKKQAKEMINAAIENDSKNGKNYILLANLYSNSANECSNTELEKKAIWQLASNAADNAALAEPKYKSTAEQLKKEYSKNTPTAEEIKQIKKAGGKIKIGCWINETVDF